MLSLTLALPSLLANLKLAGFFCGGIRILCAILPLATGCPQSTKNVLAAVYAFYILKK